MDYEVLLESGLRLLSIFYVVLDIYWPMMCQVIQGIVTAQVVMDSSGANGFIIKQTQSLGQRNI